MGRAPTWKMVPRMLDVMKMATRRRGVLYREDEVRVRRIDSPKPRIHNLRRRVRRGETDGELELGRSLTMLGQTHGRLCSTLRRLSSLDSLIMCDLR